MGFRTFLLPRTLYTQITLQMSLISIAYIILIIGGVSDFMTTRTPKIEKTIYQLTLAIVAFIFTIKYYYGVDIDTYVPHYEALPNIFELINGDTSVLTGTRFEIGYSVFCCILKTFGLSFWAMTAIVQFFYFYAIHKVLSIIEHKRTFALMIVVILDSMINYTAYRQCLSVSAYYLMFISFYNKDYYKGIAYMLISVLFHKSALFIVALTLIALFFKKQQIKQTTYQVLGVVLLIALFLPLTNITSQIISYLPFSNSTLTSIKLHLSVGKQYQIIFLVYFFSLVVIQYFSKFTTNKWSKVCGIIVLGILIICCLYQYYYLLNRLRPYFTPILVAYIFTAVQHHPTQGEKHFPYRKLIYDVAALIIILYTIRFTYTLVQHNNETERIHNYSNIFELVTTDKNEIRLRQMNLAKLFWDKYFDQGINNNHIE